MSLDKQTLASLGALLKNVDLSKLGPQVSAAEVVFAGDQITVPEGMSIPTAIETLKAREEYLNKTMSLSETYPVFPWDGAIALDTVLTRVFGWAQAKGRETWFGEQPVPMINVKVGPNQTKQVIWGNFDMRGEGTLGCDATHGPGGQLNFRLTASIKRSSEALVQRIFREVREELVKNSIYRGKAFKLQFTDDNGKVQALPEPEFIDTAKINPAQLILSADLMAAVQTNLFTPIQRVDDLKANNLPIRRGVILGGMYGTGKTLSATVAARYAVDNDVTYIYVPKAADLARAVQFAKQYDTRACVLFCEDVDRVLAGDRTAKMDELLNIIDGIDTKNSNIIVVLTTNAIETLNPAMLRPGRLDAVIEFAPPDAAAVAKLIAFYAGDALMPNQDLTEVGKLLAGNIPAVLAEVIKRAKLAQLSLLPKGEKVRGLTADALLLAGKSIKAQVDLLNERSKPKIAPVGLDGVFRDMVESAVASATETMATQVSDVHDRVGS